jgi:hypothetical protein
MPKSLLNKPDYPAPYLKDEMRVFIGLIPSSLKNKCMPMTGRFSVAESASPLPHSKIEHVRHSYSYAFRVLTQLCGKGGVPCVLKTHSSCL